MTWRPHPALMRRPWISVPVVTLLLAVVFLAPALPALNRTDLTPALELTCRPFTPATSVAGLNRVVNGYRDTEAFTGADVGASVRLTDGRQLFVFGDTLRAKGYSSDRFVRNSMLVFGRECAGVVQRRDRGAVIPDRADGVGYWPMSVQLTGHHDGFDVVTVTAQRVRNSGSTGLFAFTNLGPAIAQFRVEHDSTPVLQRVTDVGPDSSDTARPVWGAATARVGDQLYLYGTSAPTGGRSFGWALAVARAPIAQVNDVTTWRYWDGTGWQRRAGLARTLIPAQNGVSQTLSVFRQGSRWYALSKRGDVIGTDLVAWTADSPTGPFTAEPVLAKIPSAAGTGLRYMPLAHPDLVPRRGTVVVSISRNTANASAVEKDPTLYRPEFIRVTLPD